MRKLNLYLAMVAAACLASCSSIDDGAGEMPKRESSNVINFAPAKKTEIAFTSNDIDVSQNAIITWEPVTTTAIDRTAEETLVKSVLPEKNGNLDQITTDFMYYAKDADMELEFYPVYSQTTQHHKLGVFYYDEDGNKHEQIVWDNINPWGLYETVYTWNKDKNANDISYKSKGIKITIKKGYKFGFFWDGYYAADNWQSVNTTWYSKSDLNDDAYCTTGEGQRLTTRSRIHAGTFVRNGKTYLGIEDWTDFDYQDIVFTCDKEIPTVPANDVKPTPENPTEPVTPTDPDPGTTDPEQPTVPEDPADPAVKAIGGSVEVNLALNAEHEKDDWKESHLSVHVRDTTDFTLFIPIKAEYYCPQDDMMIVQKHDTDYVYNTTNETLSMVINGQTVTLDVAFSENGITFTSHGINADVLKYCRDTYGDGITFEVRNYYNDALNRTQLQEILNQSTISFTNPPAAYLYAKGIWEGVIDTLACKVLPTDAENREAEETFIGETNSAELHLFKKK